MDAYIGLLIPIFIGIIAFIIWQKRLTWWEVVLPTLVGVVVIFTMKSCMESSNLSDTEYLSSYAVTATHEDAWNEYIHQTCTRQYACGSSTDSKGHTTTTYCTETYDCSYVKYHPDEYYISCLNGQRYYISLAKYKELVKAWNNEVFVEMNRHYHTIDGDAQRSSWMGDINTVETCDWTQSYENRIQNSHSIYNFEDVSDQDKIDNKLYEYPNCSSYKTNAVLSNKAYIFQNEKNKINAVNGLLGASKKVHVWILIWEDMPKSVADMQQSYWKGGNKNELVICIGVDKKRHIKWNHIFTWSDKEIVRIKIRNYLNQLKGERLEFTKFQPFLLTEINKDWKKRNWHEFDFLAIDLTDSQLHWLYLVVTITSLIAIAWGVMNDFENDSNFSEVKRKPILNYIKEIEYKSIMNWIRKRLGIE